MYSCELCGRTCNFAPMFRYYRTQTNEEVYVCQVCQKDFNQRPLIVQHQQNQANEECFPSDVTQSSFKDASNLKCYEQNFTEDCSLSETNSSLSCQPEFILGVTCLDDTQINADHKPHILEDNILPTETKKIGSNFSYTIIQNSVKINSTMASKSILKHLLTKPERNIQEKCLNVSQNDVNREDSSIHPSLLKNLLTNGVKSKKSDTSNSILEHLLTKPLKTDHSKCLPIPSNNYQSEVSSINFPVLKNLLLRSRTGTRTKPICAETNQDGNYVPAPTTLSTPTHTEQPPSFFNSTDVIDSTNSLKIVDVVSLAGDLESSSATLTSKPKYKFENDLLLAESCAQNKFRSTDHNNIENFLSSTKNDIKFLLPTQSAKFY